MSLLPDLPIIPSIGTASDTGASNSSPNSSAYNDYFGAAVNGFIAGAFSGASNIMPSFAGTVGAANAGNKSSDKSSFPWARIAAFIVGILLIGGGIVMFKQTQVVIQSGLKAAKVAAL